MKLDKQINEVILKGDKPKSLSKNGAIKKYGDQKIK